MILMGHGAGGRLSQQLVAEHFVAHFDNPALSAMMDSAVLGDMALTTDAYVVTPRFFPGGDLGRLAVSGTVNDLCMVGATPLGLSAAFILEEGLAIDEVDRLAQSMAATAREASVQIVTGDTKVVPRGACDGVFITTSGFGQLTQNPPPSPSLAVDGDAVIISGSIGDHGMAVMACREGLRLSGELKSDVAPLRSLVQALLDAELDIHVLRDPTRGGVAQSLLEIAGAAQVNIVLKEQQLPIKPAVLSACELLGLDPLYVANEGKCLLVLPKAQADKALGVMRQHPLGGEAKEIGQIHSGRAGCEVHSALGGRRSLRMATGELLPRIC